MVIPVQRTASLPQGQISITPLGTFLIPADTALDARYTPLNVLVQPGILNQVRDVQSVWVDASSAIDPVIVRNVQTRQYMRWPPGSFGWQNLLAKADALQLEFYSFSAVTISMCVADGLLASYVIDGGLTKSSPYSTVTRVTAAAADTSLLAQNTQRQGATLFNDSTATAKVLLGAGAASATNYSYEMTPRATLETPYKYGGRIRGIWSAANGAMQITEYV